VVRKEPSPKVLVQLVLPERRASKLPSSVKLELLDTARNSARLPLSAVHKDSNSERSEVLRLLQVPLVVHSRREPSPKEPEPLDSKPEKLAKKEPSPLAPLEQLVPRPEPQELREPPRREPLPQVPKLAKSLVARVVLLANKSMSIPDIDQYCHINPQISSDMVTCQASVEAIVKV